MAHLRILVKIWSIAMTKRKQQDAELDQLANAAKRTKPNVSFVMPIPQDIVTMILSFVTEFELALVSTSFFKSMAENLKNSLPILPPHGDDTIVCICKLDAILKKRQSITFSSSLCPTRDPAHIVSISICGTPAQMKSILQRYELTIVVALALQAPENYEKTLVPDDVIDNKCPNLKQLMLLNGNYCVTFKTALPMVEHVYLGNSKSESGKPVEKVFPKAQSIEMPIMSCIQVKAFVDNCPDLKKIRGTFMFSVPMYLELKDWYKQLKLVLPNGTNDKYAVKPYQAIIYYLVVHELVPGAYDYPAELTNFLAQYCALKRDKYFPNCTLQYVQNMYMWYLVKSFVRAQTEEQQAKKIGYVQQFCNGEQEFEHNEALDDQN